jgi:hypothetical protein
MAEETVAIAELRELATTARNGIPTLQRALDAVLAAAPSPKHTTDEVQFASCVTTAVGQMATLVQLNTPGQAWRQAPDDLLVRDLPNLNRQMLEQLVVKALEPATSGFGSVVALFKGAPPLPFVSDLRALAREMIDGLTVGELRRRSTVRS